MSADSVVSRLVLLQSDTDWEELEAFGHWAVWRALGFPEVDRVKTKVKGEEQEVEPAG